MTGLELSVLSQWLEGGGRGRSKRRNERKTEGEREEEEREEEGMKVFVSYSCQNNHGKR